MKRIFVTGISTEVGKTLAAAILTEALQADYWKPVQAGELHDPDSHRVLRLLTNNTSRIHPPSYALKTAMSPHAAAAIEGIRIRMEAIREPETGNHLVIEGAGGLLVPLNETDTILDLIRPQYKVVVVSRHYLGSINHTLLTLELLKQRGLEVALLFNGNEHPTTEQIILKKTGLPSLGRIAVEPEVNREVVRRYATNILGPLASF